MKQTLVIEILCFLAGIALLSCSSPKLEHDLTGTWRLRKITAYHIANRETTATKITEITDPEFHILKFQPDHSVIQVMNNNQDTGQWSLHGQRLRLRFPYRQEPTQLIRTIHPDSQSITDEYIRSDTTLTVAVFRKDSTK